MRVVDSSIWIEWLIDTPLGRRAAAQLPENGQWIVPTVVQYELARWIARELSPKTAAETIGFTNQLIVRPLDTDIATKAADYAARYRLALADAVIYATAMDLGADLLTCDAHFKGLPGVVYLAKTGP